MPLARSAPRRLNNCGRYLDGDFVVFLIGMRINNPLLVHKVAAGRARHARMINERFRQPDLGFIHAEMWFSRTIILVQYQRNEIEARDKSRLAEATDRANDAITRLFGPGPVDGKIEAIVVVAER